FNGSRYLVVWTDYRNSDRSSADIFGALLDSGGTPYYPVGIPICRAIEYQDFAAIASDGHNFLVVWQDYRSGVLPDIYGGLVLDDGQVTTGDGVPICTAADRQDNAAIAFNGTQYLVAWEDWRSGTANIYTATVRTDG